MSSCEEIYKIVLFFVYSVHFPVEHVSAYMVCHQDELGDKEILYCPDPDEKDQSLAYCCNNNGRMSCCSYNDYYERHFGPSFTTIAALVVSHILLIIAAIYWCKKNRDIQHQMTRKPREEM